MNEPLKFKKKRPSRRASCRRTCSPGFSSGLAFLMVAIMWLTGGKKPQTPPKPRRPPLPSQAPLEVNETKIAELQNRIEELQRQQLVAQSALAQQTRLLGGHARCTRSSLQQPARACFRATSAQKIPFKPSARRAAYVSLFASNVALSYRKTPRGAPTLCRPRSPLRRLRTRSPEPDASQIAQLLKEMQPPIRLFARAPSPSAKTIPRKQPRNERRNQESCRRAGWRGQRGGRKNLRAL